MVVRGTHVLAVHHHVQAESAGLEDDDIITQLEDALTAGVVDTFGMDIVRNHAESSGKAGTADINIGVAERPTVTIVRPIDSASPTLMLNAIAGSPIGNVEVEFVNVVNDGRKAVSYLSYVFENAFVKSYDVTGDDVETSERIVLVFNSLQVTHHTVGPDSSITSSTTTGWNFIEARRK